MIEKRKERKNMKKVPVVNKERYEKVQEENYNIWKFIDDNKWILYEFDKMNRGDIGNAGYPSELVEITEPIEAVEIFKRVYFGTNPMKRGYNKNTSYGLKHYLEKDYQLPIKKVNEEKGFSTFYVSNGAVKGAMLLNGYLPQDPHEVNWRFRISENSTLIGITDRKKMACSGFSQVKNVASCREDIENGKMKYTDFKKWPDYIY